MSLRFTIALASALTCAGCRASIDWEMPPARPVTRAAVETDGAGWTRVSAGALIAAGLDPAAPSSTLSLSREGRPIAFALEVDAPMLADVGALLFWAEPARSRWTDLATYWVADGNDAGLRIGVRGVAAGPDAVAALRSVSEDAQENFYVLSLQNGAATNFVWDGAVATSGPASKTFTLDATRPLASGTFTLTLDVHGLTGFDDVAPDHHVVVEVNGHVAADATFDGAGDAEIVATGDAAWLVDGANTVTLRLPHDTGATRDTVLVRSMTLDHPRHSTVEGATVVTATAPGTYVVAGLAASTAIYDLADLAAPVRLGGGGAAAFAPPTDDEDENEPEPPTGSRLELRVDAVPARLLLAPAGSAREPASVRGSRAGAGAFRPWTGDELAIVTADALEPAAERLAEHRRSQGLTVRVLAWSVVVDAFGEGVPAPDALAALVRGNGLERPRWLLLLGDASHDPKERLSEDGEPSGNLLPAFFDDAAGLMESPSDNAIVAASAHGIPEIAVGRIPAATLDEADAVIDKLIAYDDAANTAPSTVLLAADDAVEDWEVELFHDTSEAAASLLTNSYTIERGYVGTLGAAAARTTILDTLGAGAIYVNYLGHGNYTEWANEKILTDADVAALPEHDVLPVFTVMNCLTGHFSQPNWKLRSLAEVLLVTPRRGAVAVIASSAMAYPGGQPELDLAFTQRLLADSTQPSLGDAFLQAKSLLDAESLEQRTVLQSWHLLGDPSMRVRRP